LLEGFLDHRFRSAAIAALGRNQRKWTAAPAMDWRIFKASLRRPKVLDRHWRHPERQLLSDAEEMPRKIHNLIAAAKPLP